MTSTPVDPAAASGPVDRVAECEALRAEVERLRVQVAKTHERVEFADSLVESQCPTGKHGSWFCECEYVHTCGWCEREAAEARLEAVQALVKESVHVLHPHASNPWMATLKDVRALLASPPEPETDAIGKRCEIAPAVGGLVYDRNDVRCWHEGGMWHDLVAPAPVVQPVPPTEPDKQVTCPHGCTEAHEALPCSRCGPVEWHLIRDVDYFAAICPKCRIGEDIGWAVARYVTCPGPVPAAPEEGK